MSETDGGARLLGPFRVCSMKLEADPVLGWTLRLTAIDPSCKAALRDAIQRLGPHGRRYLAKRLIAANPDTEKTLKELGLPKQEQ